MAERFSSEANAVIGRELDEQRRSLVEGTLESHVQQQTEALSRQARQNAHLEIAVQQSGLQSEQRCESIQVRFIGVTRRVDEQFDSTSASVLWLRNTLACQNSVLQQLEGTSANPNDSIPRQ